ncbi:MAG: 1,4-dihydroxy-2-naphthoate octaprenyltransferase [Candidatus Margulisiibacteriota bacterium]
MRKLFLCFAELRAPFFAASILPVLLGSIVAWNETGNINYNYLLWTLLGIMLLHAGANVANDYFDHKNGCDDNNVDFIHPFTGGSRMIQKKLLTPREVLTESVVLSIAGSLIGFYLAYKTGYPVLILGAIGIFCCYFYTTLASRCFGELAIALNFGILITLGSYYVQTLTISFYPVVIAIPLSILIGSVLYVNEFPDIAADTAAGKRNLVVRLGSVRAAKLFILITIAPYAVIGCMIIYKVMPFWTILAFLSLPLSIKALSVVLKYNNNYQRLKPANVSIILSHISAGLFIITGYIIDKH